MRIISGSAKGLRLKSPTGQTIRPTSDRAREALFSILGDRIKKASVLDLFAGTGALGLEALSRGAYHATFVDNSSDALALITTNLRLLQRSLGNSQESRVHPETQIQFSCSPPPLIIKSDLREGGFFRWKNRRDAPGCYDVVFLDPPYAKGLSLHALTFVDKSDLLCEKAIVVAEETPGTDLPAVFTTFSLFDKRRYGDTGFWFFAKP